MSVHTERLSDGSCVSVSAFKRDAEGRVIFHYSASAADGRVIFAGQDLRSGCGDPIDAREGFRSLASFVSACAESIDYRDRGHGPGENADLFPESAHEWITANAEEIGMLADDGEDGSGTLGHALLIVAFVVSCALAEGIIDGAAVPPWIGIAIFCALLTGATLLYFQAVER